MVKEEKRTEYCSGYGCNSSDDDHFIELTTECDCKFHYEIKRTYEGFVGIKLLRKIFTYHEKEMHTCKSEIESYIKHNPDTTESAIKNKFFHKPRKLIEHVLDWISRKPDRTWEIRDDSIDVYKEIHGL